MCFHGEVCFGGESGVRGSGVCASKQAPWRTSYSAGRPQNFTGNSHFMKGPHYAQDWAGWKVGLIQNCLS